MNPSRSFLIILAALPLLEIYLLLRLMGIFGFIPTLGFLLLTASAGLAVIRQQGMSALIRAQQTMTRGELPAREVIDSGIAVLGGVLLVIPGILSDLLALPCLIPALRARLADRLIASRVIVTAGRARPGNDSVIEGEFRRED